MENTHCISSNLLSLETLQETILHSKLIALSDEAKINIEKCRDYLDKKMASHSEPINVINTGFGLLCNVKISNENLSKLRENLVKSDAPRKTYFGFQHKNRKNKSNFIWF